MSNTTRNQQQRNANQLIGINNNLTGTVGSLRISRRGVIRQLSQQELKRLNKPKFNINQT